MISCLYTLFLHRAPGWVGISGRVKSRKYWFYYCRWIAFYINPSTFIGITLPCQPEIKQYWVATFFPCTQNVRGVKSKLPNLESRRVITNTEEKLRKRQYYWRKKNGKNKKQITHITKTFKSFYSTIKGWILKKLRAA